MKKDTYTCQVTKPGGAHRGCGSGARVVGARGKKTAVVFKKVSSTIVVRPGMMAMLGMPATKSKKVRVWTAEAHRGQRVTTVAIDLPLNSTAAQAKKKFLELEGQL